MRKLLKGVLDALSSYWLASLILILLFVLTVFGTFAQRDMALYDVVHRYFDSLWLVERVPLPFTDLEWVVPLPGGGVLMGLLAVNLLLGGMVRIRKTRRTAGVLVIHLGIGLLLAAGLVKKLTSYEGVMQLWEGDQSNLFQDHHQWEVAIHDVSLTRDFDQLIIPQSDFRHLKGDLRRTFHGAGLPFELELGGFQRACRPEPVAAAPTLAARAVDGWVLTPVEPNPRGAEMDTAGLRVTARPQGGAPPVEGLLWGFERYPWTFQAGGRTWAVTLRKKVYRLPFEIRLDDFHHEFHPRTQKPSVFRSSVTVIEAGEETPVRISMNRPLRDRGYTVFQTGWGPQDERDPERMYSGLTIVSNPSDQWPKWACWVIAAGLLWTFGERLLRWLWKQNQAQSAAATAGAPPDPDPAPAREARETQEATR